MANNEDQSAAAPEAVASAGGEGRPKAKLGSFVRVTSPMGGNVTRPFSVTCSASPDITSLNVTIARGSFSKAAQLVAGSWTATITIPDISATPAMQADTIGAVGNPTGTMVGASNPVEVIIS